MCGGAGWWTWCWQGSRAVTEAEWILSTDIRRMVDSLVATSPFTQRTARLFGCACCQRVWHHLEETGREVVAIIERWADEAATDQHVAPLRSRVEAVSNE